MFRNVLAAAAFSVLTLLSTTAMAAAVATVNGEEIKAEVVERNLAQLPEIVLSRGKDEIRKTIIDRLIEQTLIRQQAEKMQLESNAQFQDQLKQAREALITNFVLQAHVDEVVTEKALREAYTKAKDAYAQPAINAAHILVETEEEAKSVIAQLDNGADFTALAKEKSTGPSGKNGGDLGWFAAGDMVKPFSDAAFNMKAGTYSKTPVKTQFGWHVIKVNERDDNRAPGFKEMEEQLRQSLTQQAVQDYLTQLKEKATINYVN